MLSGYSDSPAPPDSILENTIDDILGEAVEPLDSIGDSFSDVCLKGRSGLYLDMLYSPDNMQTTLHEYLIDSHLVDGLNSQI